MIHAHAINVEVVVKQSEDICTENTFCHTKTLTLLTYKIYFCDAFDSNYLCVVIDNYIKNTIIVPCEERALNVKIGYLKTDSNLNLRACLLHICRQII